MPRRLYLDTARLGLMSPRAQRAQQDFIRLAGIEGGSLYFEDFLRRGFSAWPRRLQARYTGLCHWQGVSELKHALRRLLGLQQDRIVLIASRSAQLMRLAARLLFRRCQRVLSTDLLWPSYARILEFERQRTQSSIHHIPVRHSILLGQTPPQEIIHRVVENYLTHRCDGLFLPAVSHDGIRLPLAEICRSIPESKAPRFVAIDGARSLCHVPPDTTIDHCDFYLTGCHKWFQAGLPMGLAFCPRSRSQGFIQEACRRMQASFEVDDALLSFASQLEQDVAEPFSETVSLAPLFSCRAALAEHAQKKQSVLRRYEKRLANATLIADVVSDTCWRPLLPMSPFRSAILLLQAQHPGLMSASPETVRADYQAHGITLTSYDGGIIRLSLPHTRLDDRAIARILEASRQVSGNTTFLRPRKHAALPAAGPSKPGSRVVRVRETV